MEERAAGTVEAVFHEEWGRLLATLIRWLGDFDLAEEVAAEALAAAVERWPKEGVPTQPTAWLLTTARRRAIDVLRRQKTYAAKLAILQVEADRGDASIVAARGPSRRDPRRPAAAVLHLLPSRSGPGRPRRPDAAVPRRSVDGGGRAGRSSCPRRRWRSG